jgi:methyltransferase
MTELLGIDTRVLYSLLIGLVVAERLVELAVTQRNRRWALAQGGVEVGEDHYRWMVVVHTLFLIACPAEVWLLERPFVPWLGAAMLVLLLATMGLRYWAISTLGRRWTTRVVCVPGLPVVTGGPYRFVRHPNYLAVVLEILALPLIHTAWLTALIFSVANVFVLRTRIRVEEEALSHYNDYEESFPDARMAHEG